MYVVPEHGTLPAQPSQLCGLSASGSEEARDGPPMAASGKANQSCGDWSDGCHHLEDWALDHVDMQALERLVRSSLAGLKDIGQLTQTHQS